MHIKPLPRNEPLKVTFDGKLFEVTFDGDGNAHVPESLGRYMLAQGLVTVGHDPNPKPRFERIGDMHGKPLGMFDPWCREVN